MAQKEIGSKERQIADSIKSILDHQHHKLLVTLLLVNALAMEALPLFLDVIVPAWVSILLSVSFVLLFGEIIPQALCAKNALQIR